jgi:hypothetical protein
VARAEEFAQTACDRREVHMLEKLSGAAFGALLTLSGALALGGTAMAQNFPTHPMVMVIPFAAGAAVVND